MTDVAIKWDTNTYNGDFQLDDADLLMGDQLETAIYMSIFTWRRANDDDIVLDGDRKGWWGDSYSEIDGDQIGSRLWLYFREKITPTILLEIRDVIQESLDWLVDDNVASNVDVTVERNTAHGIHTVSANVVITRTTGREINLRFEDLWKELR